MDIKRTVIYIVLGLGAIILLLLGVSMFTGEPEATVPDGSGTTTDPFGSGSGERSIGSNPDDPFYQNATSTIPGRIITPGEEHARLVGIIEKIYQPASAAVAIAAVTEERTVIERALFVDRTNGHLLIRNLVPNESFAKYTNTTIPRIQRATISHNGSSTIFQYLDAGRRESVESFSGTLSTPPEVDSASPEEERDFMTLSGRFLPPGIEEYAFSPNAQQIAYISKEQTGGALIIALKDGTGAKQVAAFEFSQILVSWPSPSTIIVTTKASANTPGIAFLVNPDSGAVRRILSGAQGLTTLGSPDGKFILYSTVASNVTSLNVLAVDSLVSKRLPVATLPEKCVWSRLSPSIVYCAVPRSAPAAGYPDTWYRGQMHTNDLIWRIDIASEAVDIVAPPSQGPDVSFDGVGLSLGPQELHLLFINKVDDTLYGVALPNVPVPL